MPDSFGELTQVLKTGSEDDKMRVLKKDWRNLFDNINNRNLSVNLLVDNLESSKDAWLRHKILSLIGKLDWSKSKTSSRLAQLARDPKEDERVRLRIIEFFSWKAEEPLELLDELLLQEKNVSIRKTVVGSLGRVTVTKQNIQHLRRLFQRVFIDPRDDVRYVGFESLRELGRANGELLRIGKSENPLVAVYFLAARMFHRKDDVTISGQLIEFLRHGDLEVKQGAARGLEYARAFKKEHLILLNEALLREPSSIRYHLCEMLCYGDPSFGHLMTNLAACLRDSAPTVRGTAAVAVGKLQMKERVPDLISMFNDSDEVNRNLALQGLNYMGDASPTVLEAIADAQKRNQIGAEDAKMVLTELKRQSK